MLKPAAVETEKILSFFILGIERRLTCFLLQFTIFSGFFLVYLEEKISKRREEKERTKAMDIVNCTK